MTDDTPEERLSTAQLLTRLSDQSSRLIQDEFALARLEMKQSARNAGLGGGLLGAAGILALLGLGALTSTAIIALDLVVALWLAALIVTVVVFILASVAALIGKNRLHRAPAGAQRTSQRVKGDIHEVKEGTA